MNTKDFNKVRSMTILNPEVKEAVDLIYKDVTNRLFGAINAYQDQQEDDTHVKSFLEGKKDAYWNIQDMLAKLKI